MTVIRQTIEKPLKTKVIRNVTGFSSNEKILVTGGTGFLGRYTVEELISHGIFPTILTRNSKARILWNQELNLNRAEIDLLDTNILKIFLENLRPTYIVHLAGVTHPVTNRLAEFEKNNFQATVNLLELALTLKIKRLIIIGTADEYGFQSCPQTETMKTSPISEYAISKNKAVNYALSLYEKHDLPVVILRPFTIYGIGQPSRMFVSQAVECAVKGIAFEMSKGEQKRDLLFVTDFADAIIKTLTAENIEGEIFNVGSGKAIALRDLAERVWDIAGADKKTLKIGARYTNQNELHDTEADISKIRKRLNWQPKISLEEGLTFLIDKAKNDLE